MPLIISSPRHNRRVQCGCSNNRVHVLCFCSCCSLLRIPHPECVNAAFPTLSVRVPSTFFFFLFPNNLWDREMELTEMSAALCLKQITIFFSPVLLCSNKTRNPYIETCISCSCRISDVTSHCSRSFSLSFLCSFFFFLKNNELKLPFLWEKKIPPDFYGICQYIFGYIVYKKRTTKTEIK